MSAAQRKRRSPGEGGAYPYKTAAGVRYRVKGQVRQADGTLKQINRRKGANGETWTTKEAALAWLHDQQSAGRKGEYVEPSSQGLGAYGAEVIEGLRIRPQTRASYVKNWRNHIEPYPIAAVPLAQLTGVRLTSHYRMLEKSGRKDYREGEGLSARTVRYIHTIIHGVLGQAVTDSLLLRNPADAARPPTAQEAKAPEMTCWTAAQLAAFLAWASEHSHNHPLWHSLAMTGERRGEWLAARWRDLDMEAGAARVRRSAGMVRVAGKSAETIEGDTKSSKPRVVDVDAATVAIWRAHRMARGSMALQLARDDALVYGDPEGRHRNPEHVSRQFVRDVARCRKALGEDALPMIRLHDLRHTHATILLLAGVPVHVVSQRLGHASPMVTMTVYAHVMPGNQKDAADMFARLIAEASA
jgi:integrase